MSRGPESGSGVYNPKPESIKKLAKIRRMARQAGREGRLINIVASGTVLLAALTPADTIPNFVETAVEGGYSLVHKGPTEEQRAGEILLITAINETRVYDLVVRGEYDPKTGKRIANVRNSPDVASENYEEDSGGNIIARLEEGTIIKEGVVVAGDDPNNREPTAKWVVFKIPGKDQVGFTAAYLFEDSNGQISKASMHSVRD